VLDFSTRSHTMLTYGSLQCCRLGLVQRLVGLLATCRLAGSMGEFEALDKALSDYVAQTAAGTEPFDMYEYKDRSLQPAKAACGKSLAQMATLLSLVLAIFPTGVVKMRVLTAALLKCNIGHEASLAAQAGIRCALAHLRRIALNPTKLRQCLGRLDKDERERVEKLVEPLAKGKGKGPTVFELLRQKASPGHEDNAEVDDDDDDEGMTSTDPFSKDFDTADFAREASRVPMKQLSTPTKATTKDNIKNSTKKMNENKISKKSDSVYIEGLGSLSVSLGTTRTELVSFMDGKRTYLAGSHNQQTPFHREVVVQSIKWAASENRAISVAEFKKKFKQAMKSVAGLSE
jgi:hypothetical protein